MKAYWAEVKALFVHVPRREATPKQLIHQAVANFLNTKVDKEVRPQSAGQALRRHLESESGDEKYRVNAF